MASIRELVAAIAQEEGLDPALALAVAARESNFNPRALGAAKEVGVMQLTRGAAAEVGVAWPPWDPVENIRGGVRYLQQQLLRFGDVALALAAYNCGPRCVADALRAGGDWMRRIPASTREYVADVLRRMGLAPAPVYEPPVYEPPGGLPTYRAEATATPLMPDWAWLLLGLLALALVTE